MNASTFPSIRVQGVPPTFDTNFGISGTLVYDDEQYAAAGFLSTNASNPLVAVSGLWNVASSQGGIMFFDNLRNDAGNDGVTTNGGTTAKSRAGATNGLDMFIRLIRSNAFLDDAPSGSVVYTGTWTHQGSIARAMSGTQSFTSTNGDKVTITTPVGTDFTLVLIGLDDAQTGLNGAAFTITVDGNPYPVPFGIQSTCSNALRFTGPQSPLTSGTGQLAIPLVGLSNQAHTVVLTHADTTGKFMLLDGLLTTNPNPRAIMLNKVAQLPQFGYNAYVANGGLGASFAVDLIYNAIVDTVVNRFPKDQSILVFDPNNPTNPAGVWNPATMISDGIHPNDRGSAYYADNIMAILNTLQPRLGLGIF
jgi:hypothetical protein